MRAYRWKLQSDSLQLQPAFHTHLASLQYVDNVHRIMLADSTHNTTAGPKQRQQTTTVPLGKGRSVVGDAKMCTRRQWSPACCLESATEIAAELTPISEAFPVSGAFSEIVGPNGCFQK